MTFFIELLPETTRGTCGQRLGRIQIGDFVERFIVSVPEGQDISALPSQWIFNLEQLLKGAGPVGLKAQPDVFWVFYRIGEQVFIRDQRIVPAWEGEIANDGTIAKFPERRVDNTEVSEWETMTREIQEFLDLTRSDPVG